MTDNAPCGKRCIAPNTCAIKGCVLGVKPKPQPSAYAPSICPVCGDEYHTAAQAEECSAAIEASRHPAPTAVAVTGGAQDGHL